MSDHAPTQLGPSDTPAAETPPATPIKAKKKSDLGPRVVTAVIAVPIVLWMVIWGPHEVFGAFLLACCVAGLWEFNHMLQLDEPRSVPWVSTLFGASFYVVVYLFIGQESLVDVGGHQSIVLLATLSAMMWASFLYNLMRPRDIPRVATTMSSPLAAVLYVGVGFVLIALMKRDLGEWGPGWIVLLLAMIWSSDTGAYFAGRALGKHKLAPRVSPNKTIEGALGGLAGTVVAALLVGTFMLEFLSILDILVIALVANVLGQTGDLCESLIKRSVGVKDSGTIIHGHGGMLDRVDAVLFAAPFVYLYGALSSGTAILG